MRISQVFDGPSEETGVKLGDFTGYDVPNAVVSTSNDVTVTFDSDQDNFPFIDVLFTRWKASYTLAT